MTWTYTGDPSASNRDEVRFLCGDTISTDQLATDEEIAYAIASAGSNGLAAAIVCEALAARFARFADVSVGAARESCSQKSRQFAEKAADLRRKYGALLALSRFGGQTISEKEAFAADTDAIQPSFQVGQQDSPEASTTLDGNWDTDTDWA